MQKTIFCLVLFFRLYATDLSAQSTERDVLANAGGTAVIPGYIVTWTLGEAFVATRENAMAQIIITEGFQQPDSIATVPTIELPGEGGPTVTVSPNPAGNSLSIMLSENPANPVHLQLTDANGRNLREETLSSQATSLDLRGLPAALYFLSLSDGKDWAKTLKVVKQ